MEKLISAIAAHDVAAVQAALDPPPFGGQKMSTAGRETPLVAAIREDNLQIVSMILEAGADPNERSLGWTPLFWCVVGDHTALAEAVLKHGANVDDAGNTDTTPLVEAVREASLDMVKLLLNAGAKHNAVDERGLSPLFWAAHDNSVDVVQLLLEAGGDVSQTNPIGQRPLYAAIRNSSLEAAELLRGADAKLSVLEAVLLDDVKLLEDTVASLSEDALALEAAAVNENHQTPFFWAASLGQEHAVKLLLDAGADPAVVSDGWHGLGLAVFHGHVGAVRAILAHPKGVSMAKLPIIDSGSQTTVLHQAVRGLGRRDIVVELLRAGADVDALDGFHLTPLAWAAKANRQDLVAELVNYAKANSGSSGLSISHFLSWFLALWFPVLIGLLVFGDQDDVIPFVTGKSWLTMPVGPYGVVSLSVVLFVLLANALLLSSPRSPFVWLIWLLVATVGAPVIIGALARVVECECDESGSSCALTSDSSDIPCWSLWHETLVVLEGATLIGFIASNMRYANSSYDTRRLHVWLDVDEEDVTGTWEGALIQPNNLGQSPGNGWHMERDEPLQRLQMAVFTLIPVFPLLSLMRMSPVGRKYTTGAMVASDGRLFWNRTVAGRRAITLLTFVRMVSFLLLTVLQPQRWSIILVTCAVLHVVVHTLVRVYASAYAQALSSLLWGIILVGTVLDQPDLTLYPVATIAALPVLGWLLPPFRDSYLAPWGKYEEDPAKVRTSFSVDEKAQTIRGPAERLKRRVLMIGRVTKILPSRMKTIDDL